MESLIKPVMIDDLDETEDLPEEEEVETLGLDDDDDDSKADETEEEVL